MSGDTVLLCSPIIFGVLLSAAGFGLSKDAIDTFNDPLHSSAGVIKVLVCTLAFVGGGVAAVFGLFVLVVGN